MEKIADIAAHGGRHQVWRHDSQQLNCMMEFALFVPPGNGPFKPLYFLSGLTCTWENAATKAGAYALAAKLGVALIFPDTSPRGDDVANDDHYALGQGAGFYMTATQEPWSQHYRMDSYICDELVPLIRQTLPIGDGKAGITGHSMGGHGALTLAMKRPDLFASLSAFAPIVAPSEVPWGRTIFSHYIGDNHQEWLAYDACALIQSKGWDGDILIDIGSDDPFYEEQLIPERFEQAAASAGVALTMRKQIGYDHSYYFVSSFIDDHIKWHAERLS